MIPRDKNFAYANSLFALGMAVSLDFRFSKEFISFVSISTGEIVIWTILCLFLIKNKLLIEKKDFFGSGYKNSVFLYLVWAVIVLAVGLDREVLLIVRDLITCTVLFVLVVEMVECERSLIRVIYGYIVGVLINILIGFSQVLYDWPRPISFEESGADLKESLDGGVVITNIAMGLFPHSNVLAMHIVAASLLAVALCINNPDKKVKIFLGAVAALGLFELFYCYSKGAFLWAGLGCFSLLIRNRIPDKFRLLYVLSVVFGSVFVIVGFVVPYLIEEGLGGTILTRITLANVVVDVLNENLVGAIFGNNNGAVLSWSSSYSTFEYGNAHNVYINQVVFFGVIGLVLFGNFLIRSLKPLAMHYSQELTSLRDSIWTGVIAVLGTIYFEPFHQGVYGIGTLYLFLAFSVSLHKIKN